MQKKKSKMITFEIEVPEQIEIILEKDKISMKKNSKEITREINPLISLSKDKNKILLSTNESRRENKRLLGTTKSHLKNMIDGITNGFEYELEICNVHFPMTVTYDKTKGEFTIKNMLGERVPRIIKTSNPNKIEVEIKPPHIKIRSHDLELAGQTAANLEKLTRIRNRDRNKFQDGIFIIKKPGQET